MERAFDGALDAPPPPALSTHRVHAVPGRPPWCRGGGLHGTTTVAALAARQTGRLPPAHRAALRAASLRRRSLTRTLDAAAPPAASTPPPHWARKRSRVVEVAAAGGVLLALTAAGGATAYDARSGRLLARLNDAADTVVRSLFVNKAAGDVVTVAVSRRDGYGALRCAAVALAAIRDHPDPAAPPPARPLFGGTGLRWPGFVEFDDVNGVAIAADAETGGYAVTDLTTYAPRFRVPAAGVREVRTAPGVLLLVGDAEPAADGGGGGARVPCRLVSIHDGAPLAAFAAPVPPGARVDFIELFAGQLMVGASAREGGGGAPSLTLVDVATGAARAAPAPAPAAAPLGRPPLPTPSAFIFLHDARRCLAFGRDGTACVLDAGGARGPDLAGVALAAPAAPGGPAANTVYVTADQQYVVSYGRVAVAAEGGKAGLAPRSPSPDGPHTPPAEAGDAASSPASSRPTVGAVTVSHVATGATVARLVAAPGDEAAAAALESVTALFYDEDAGAVVTGGADGRVSVWAS